MKVLVGFIMDGKAGGIDKYLLNVLEQVSGDGFSDQRETVHQEKHENQENQKIQGEVTLDFLTNEVDADLQKKLADYGSKIYAIPNLKHPKAQYDRVRKILAHGNYDAVYFNISTAIDLIAAKAAKDAGVKRRMIHSHSSGNDCESKGKRFVFDFIHGICKHFLYRYGNEFYGCSVKAGEWLFPKKIVESDDFHVIHNAVDRKRFAYDPERRATIRKELGCDTSGMKPYVYGHIGNFSYPKNHYFLLEIFAAIRKIQPEARLWLAGDGVRFEEVKSRVKCMGLEDCIEILGRRSDADDLYQGMDAFLLPSNFEGLPIVGIEAQSAGLPCFMSDAITRESKITKDCYFLPLKETPEYWAEKIVKKAKKREAAGFLENADVYDLERQTLEILGLFQNL